jgi:hypothetical protein
VGHRLPESQAARGVNVAGPRDRARSDATTRWLAEVFPEEKWEWTNSHRRTGTGWAHRRRDAGGGRIRPVWHPGGLDRDRCTGRASSACASCRTTAVSTTGAGNPAGGPANQPRHWLLRGREQGVRPPVFQRRESTRSSDGLAHICMCYRVPRYGERASVVTISGQSPGSHSTWQYGDQRWGEVAGRGLRSLR